MFCNGTFDEDFEGKFLFVEASIQSSHDIRKRAANARAPRLLIPAIISECKFVSVPKVAFGYFFDTTLSDSISEPFFAHADGQLNDKWMNNSRAMLETLEIMHQKGLRHGKLGEDDSYVYVGDKLFIVWTTIARDDAEPAKDIEDFLMFLWRQSKKAQRDVESKDWDHFTNLNALCSTEQLRKHPVLLNGEEKCHLIRQIADDYEHNMLNGEETMLRNHLDKLPFADWNSFMPDNSALKEIYRFSQFQSDTNAFDLFKYSRKVLEHYTERNSKLTTPQRKVALARIGKEFSVVFPGFLSHVHGILCKVSKRHQYSNSGISTRPLPYR